MLQEDAHGFQLAGGGRVVQGRIAVVVGLEGGAGGVVGEQEGQEGECGVQTREHEL